MKARKPQKTKATLLYCSLQQFNSVFEDTPPEEAFPFANYVLTNLSKVIIKHSGTVDKFVGNTLIAYFDELTNKNYHAQFACQCALKLIEEINIINASDFFLRKMILTAGIAIHSGDISLGNITVGNKLITTIYGNCLTEIEQILPMTQFFSVDIITTKDTFDSCEKNFDFKSLNSLTNDKNIKKLYWLLPTNILHLK